MVSQGLRAAGAVAVADQVAAVQNRLGNSFPLQESCRLSLGNWRVSPSPRSIEIIVVNEKMQNELLESVSYG